MKIAIFCILLVISINQSVYSSNIDTSGNYYGQLLDSIVMTGNIKQLQIEIEKLKTTIPKDSSLSTLCDGYVQILRYKSNFSSENSSKLLRFIKSRKIEQRYFSESFAGTQSFVSYDKFLKFADANENLEAAKYYFIANYFRTQHINQNIEVANIVLRKARENYNNNEYQKALDYIQANKIDPGNNHILLSYQDSLSVVKNSALVKQNKINNKELYWDSKKSVIKNWQLSFGMHATFQPVHTDLSFDFNNQTPPALYADILSPKKNNVGISLDVLRSLSESFAVGADLMISKYSFSSEFDMSLVYFDYSYDVITTHLKSVFYLRKHVGFRPYLGLGLGYFRASRDESDVRVIVNPIGNITNDYILAEQTITSMQSVYELGLQFIRAENSKLFFNLKTSLFQNHKENPEIKSSLMTISMHIGFLM